MPTINIQIFEGRTVEQKRELVKAITEATVKTLQCSEGAVDIIIQDVKKENWATGGKLWSDWLCLMRFHGSQAMKPFTGLFPETV